MEVHIPDEDGTRAWAGRLAKILSSGDVVVLEGDLGAGKTFFSRALARGLGVPEDVPVTSPTFTLLHEYDARVPLLHGDLYRLSHPDELVELGLFERMGRDAICLLEWGEQFAEDLGRVDLLLRFAMGDGEQRTLSVEAHSARGEALLAALQVF